MSAMAAPAAKVARQAAVVRILSDYAVRSQAELAERLAQQGIQTTQATLSRDLVELGAQKSRRPDGGFAYIVPTNIPVPPDRTAASIRLARLAAELVVAADHTGNLLVLHTPPGAARYLGSALDAALGARALGTVAGDDTTITVMRHSHMAADLCARILAGLPPLDDDADESV